MTCRGITQWDIYFQNYMSIRHQPDVFKVSESIQKPNSFDWILFKICSMYNNATYSKQNLDIPVFLKYNQLYSTGGRACATQDFVLTGV